MSAPLRKRLGFADRSAEARTDRGTMARALMYAFAAGGLLAVASLAVASPDHLPRAAVSAALACAVAGLLLAAYDELPRWTFPPIVALGVLLVEWTVYAGGAGAAPYAVLLALPVAYSAHFFTKRVAAAETLLAVGGYAAAALAGPQLDSKEVAVTGLALLAIGGLVGMQRANVNRLIWRLSDAAVTDVLTGLHNRRGFQEVFDTELERARRSGQPLSLVVGDLDHFKSVNDGFGHGAGDSALERLSLILRTAKRRIDTAARIGGEEFAVILPDSDQHAAFILAERMRREVRESFVYEPFELTISLGVATFPLHGTTVAELVSQADQALYAAKALGRDRTVVFSQDLGRSVSEATGESAPRSRRNTATVLALAEQIDARDNGTGAHSQTVGRYAAAIAREMGLPDDAIERVRFGGIVHDVGKIGVPEAILRKPGWLTAEDWHEMRRHPEIGARILAGAQLDDVGGWVLAHHERPDGTGYPHGLAGPDIPLEARILAVADAFEAMTSDRVYRAAMAPGQARAELVRCTGTQFDKLVVEAFLRVLDSPSETPGLRLVGQ
jgi:diguanylate cyclase (GGDEF)-like protein